MSAAKLRALQTALWLAYAVVWLGGVGGHLLAGGTPANMTWAAPLFLLLASLLVIVHSPNDWRALLLSFALGFLAEALGVASGYPFGGYTYTTVLNPTVLGVPPLVAGAWMILIAWTRQMRLSAWAGALLMTIIDLVIDPLAANTLAFWKWRTTGPYYGIPLSNYLGWFIVSLIILQLLKQVPARSAAVLAVGCSILMFFALVGLAHGFAAPAALGILLCCSGYWRWRSSIRSTNI